MPVQINEVVIKTVVDNTPAIGSQSPAANTSIGDSASEAQIAALVLEIIKEKNER